MQTQEKVKIKKKKPLNKNKYTYEIYFWHILEMVLDKMFLLLIFINGPATMIFF